MGKQAEGNGARRRQRRSCTPEFKAEVIALVRRGERSLPASKGNDRANHEGISFNVYDARLRRLVGPR